jgi:hypothetical protein
MNKESFGYKIGQLAFLTEQEREKLMARRPQSGDNAEDNITTEDGGSKPQDHTVAVLVEDHDPQPQGRRRRVQRREEQPFTGEERLAIEQEIINANGGMREVEEHKKAQDKIWNGQITEYEATMNEAIDVLKKGTFTVDVERIEEFNYDNGMVYYYNTETGDEVDCRDMTDEDKQTKMAM